MNERLQSDLASADPVRGGDDAELHDLVRRVAADAQATATTGIAGSKRCSNPPRSLRSRTTAAVQPPREEPS